MESGTEERGPVSLNGGRAIGGGGGMVMSKSLKSIVTIAVWLLFIKGALGAIAGCLALMLNRYEPLECVGVSMVGVSALLACAVAAWFRKKLD